MSQGKYYDPVKDARPQSQSLAWVALARGRRKGGIPLLEMEETFQLPKTYQMILFQTKPLRFFVFSILFLISLKGGHHHHHRTEGREIFSDAKARKLCSPNKKNLA